jgi:hypothetical protein
VDTGRAQRSGQAFPEEGPWAAGLLDHRRFAVPD